MYPNATNQCPQDSCFLSGKLTTECSPASCMPCPENAAQPSTNGLCRFIVGHKGLGDWLFCTIISGVGLPLSFLLWHRSLYKSAITDGACM